MTALMKPSAAVKRPARQAMIALCLLFAFAASPFLAYAQNSNVVAKDSARWHYERALALYVAEKPGRALASLYASLDQAEIERQALETLAKSRLSVDDKEKIEKVEREAKDRRLAGSQPQRNAQQLFKREMEILVKKNLTAAQLSQWHSLKRGVAEAYHLLGFLHFQNQRAVDTLTDLRQVVDVADSIKSDALDATPAVKKSGATPNGDKDATEPDANNDDLPEHVPARLLLARAYQQLKVWDKVATHAVHLLRELNLTDARAQAALRRLSFYLGKPNKATKLPQALDAVLELADEALSDPVAYRAATIDKGIRDSLVYADLAQHFAEDEDFARTEAVLLEQLAARDGFAPIAYIGLGEIAERRARMSEAESDVSEALAKYALAIQRYELAVAQMKQLGLTPENGDVDLARLEELRKKVFALEQTGR